MHSIEFIAATHNATILKNNLLESPIFPTYHLQVIVDMKNIPRAYNNTETTKDIVCYIHHDVYLPPEFEGQLLASLRQLPNDWEVLGVAGVIGGPDFTNKRNIGFIKDRGRTWGTMFTKPMQVDTIDELLLITRGDIKFDEQFEQDFYGADICMERRCFVLPCFVYHNSSRAYGQRTESFYRSEKLFREKWKHKLPITTTCAYVA